MANEKASKFANYTKSVCQANFFLLKGITYSQLTIKKYFAFKFFIEGFYLLGN